MRYEKEMGSISFFFLLFSSFFASVLAFFSGFGLTTLLLPLLVIFLPLPLAVSATAIIHLANNLFKALLVWKSCDWKIVWKFGSLSWIASILGAYLFAKISFLEPILIYSIGFRDARVTWIGLLIGTLLIVSLCLEFLEKQRPGALATKYLSIGGVLSGFFGGISGNQGVIRSAFLIQLNLAPNVFIATSVFCSLIVDIPRTVIYGITYFPEFYEQSFIVLLFGALSAAFMGSLAGIYLLPKITILGLKSFVSFVVVVFSLLIMVGIL